MPLNYDVNKKTVIRVDVFTPNDEDISKQDKNKINKMFFRFVLYVALLLFGLFLTVISFDLFMLICTLFMLFNTVTAGRIYYSAAAGRGLRTTYLFSANTFSVINENEVTEMPYLSIKSAVQRDDGLVLELINNVIHFLPIDAIDECISHESLYSLLKGRLQSKYTLYTKNDVEEKAELQKKELEKKERQNALGQQITDIAYTVTGDDMRAYHRIVLRRQKKLRHVLISVIAAFATVLPFINAVTEQPIYYSLFCILLVILALLFFIPKIGLSLPARLCFLAIKNEKIECFVHEKGIAVKCGKRRFFEKWENMDEVVFDETEGFYADMGQDCTVFFPSDLIIEPVTAIIKENYQKAISQTKI